MAQNHKIAQKTIILHTFGVQVGVKVWGNGESLTIPLKGL